MRGSGNPEEFRPLPARKGWNDPASHPSQAGACNSRPGFLWVLPLATAKHKWDPRGRQAGKAGPRASPSPGSGMWSKRGHRGGAGQRGPGEGTPEVARGRGRLLPGVGSGSPPSSQAPTSHPHSSGGPCHHYWATPLPLPGSAVQPAPRTPSF